MKTLTSPAVQKSDKLDTIFFPVKIVDLEADSAHFPGLRFGSKYSQAVYLPSFNKIVNMAGSNYKLTPNAEFFTPLYDELVKTFGHSQINIKTINEDDSRFVTDFVINNKELRIAKKDVIKLMVRARNSYDGTQKASIEFLAYRQVCTNGLHAWTTYESEGLSKGILKHNADISALLQGLGSSLNSLKLNIDRFKPFTDRIVTGHELDTVMERLKSIKGPVSFPKKILPEVPAKIEEEMAVLGSHEVSAWQVYNGFNYFLNHDTRINLGESIKSKIDHQVKDTMADLLQISSFN